MKKIRLYIDNKTLSQDISLELTPKQSHYTCNVMRLKKNNNLFIFNGRDGEWLGEIVSISHNKLVKVVIKQCVKRQEECKKNLYLYCPIVKNNALNNIIRQATEMGVTCIQFIVTEYTAVKSVNLTRTRLQAIEAAQQCGRINVPEILPAINFRDLPDSQDRNFILCNKTEQKEHFNKIHKNKKNIAVIVGPEGGFSCNELNFADKFCQKLNLGKRTLRVDTAVVAALTFANINTIYLYKVCTNNEALN
ncbi:MAG: 16S rRNA (uracil(1498)-N(3))-methyltransferase [Wolbachia endosymbiont of Meromenopon meropis]|nr:16S rRNA (uracil(1498)-N(3))-methyltransferase [Wolbachia endosymbiont of Meromenopon meropis]